MHKKKQITIHPKTVYPDPTKPIFKPEPKFPLPSTGSLFFIGFNVIFLIVFGITYLLMTRSTSTPAVIEEKIPIILTPTLTPIPAPSFKTYTNTRFNFSVNYPIEGRISEDRIDTFGECGNAIKEGIELQGYSYALLLDNFFYVGVKPWTGTISDYLIQERATDIYETRPITNSNAEEALRLVTIRLGAKYESGFPPLSYVQSIYKKNGNLFFILGLQNYSNFGGCVHSNSQDQEKTIDSFKFN